MKTEQIVIFVVAFVLGILLLNVVKNVCGCELKEGYLNYIVDGERKTLQEDAAGKDCGETIAEYCGGSDGITPDTYTCGLEFGPESGKNNCRSKDSEYMDEHYIPHHCRPQDAVTLDSWIEDVCGSDFSCSGINCGDHGTCVRGTSSTQPSHCECNDGYTGDQCQEGPTFNTAICTANVKNTEDQAKQSTCWNDVQTGTGNACLDNPLYMQLYCAATCCEHLGIPYTTRCASQEGDDVDRKLRDSSISMDCGSAKAEMESQGIADPCDFNIYPWLKEDVTLGQVCQATCNTCIIESGN